MTLFYLNQGKKSIKTGNIPFKQTKCSRSPISSFSVIDYRVFLIDNLNAHKEKSKWYRNAELGKIVHKKNDHYGYNIVYFHQRTELQIKDQFTIVLSSKKFFQNAIYQLFFI